MPRYVEVGDLLVYKVMPIRTVHQQQPSGWIDAQPGKSLPPEPIQLSEALAMLDFGLKVPAWSPEGFELNRDRNMPPGPPYRHMFMSWWSSGREAIWLSARKWEGDDSSEVKAAQGKWEEVNVRGGTGVLGRGGFPLPDPWNPVDVETQQLWEDESGLTLVWTDGGVEYRLWTDGLYLSAEDLVRTAEWAR